MRLDQIPSLRGCLAGVLLAAGLVVSSPLQASSMIVITTDWQAPSPQSWNGSQGQSWYSHSARSSPPANFVTFLLLFQAPAFVIESRVEGTIKLEARHYKQDGKLNDRWVEDPQPLSGLHVRKSKTCFVVEDWPFDPFWFECELTRQENLGSFKAGRYRFTSTMTGSLSLVGSIPFLDRLPPVPAENAVNETEQIDFLCQEGEVWDWRQERCKDPNEEEEEEPNTCPDPEKMERLASNGECVCKDPWIPSPRHETLTCISKDEFQQQLKDDFETASENLRDIVVRNQANSIEVDVCWTVEVIDTQGGIRTIYRCETWTIHYFGGGSPKKEQSLEHDGLGWNRRADDPHPASPIVTPPFIDLLDVFGPCYEVDGVPITPCEGGGNGTALPDLLISSAGMSHGSLIVGDPLRPQFTVANTGVTTAANSEYEVTYRLPGGQVRSQRGWVGSLGPGSVRHFEVSSVANMTHPFTATPGTFEIEIEVDHSHQVSEAREYNNDHQLSVTAASGQTSGVDLRVGPIEFDKTNPAVGHHVSAEFEIENLGSHTAPASIYHFLAEQGDGNTETLTVSVPSLAPGGGFSSSQTVLLEAAGALQVRVEADWPSLIAESNEGNNARSHQVQVHPDTPCLACTSGNPSHVGARLCFDPGSGPSNLGSMWECFGVRADGSTCEPQGNHPNGWGWADDRCPDPGTLCSGTLHPDRCGNPDICPGTLSCN